MVRLEVLFLKDLVLDLQVVKVKVTETDAKLELVLIEKIKTAVGRSKVVEVVLAVAVQR